MCIRDRFWIWPRRKTIATMTAMAMTAMMSAYSTRPWPSSSRMNLSMCNSPFLYCLGVSLPAQTWAGRLTPRQYREGELHMLTFIREDEGQGLVEYALIIAVIAIAVIVAMVFLRGQIQNIFSNIGNNLT